MAIQEPGTNNLQPLTPWPKCPSTGNRTQGRGDKTLGAKREWASLFKKCLLWLPRGMRGATCGRLNTTPLVSVSPKLSSAGLCSCHLPRFRGPRTTSQPAPWQPQQEAAMLPGRQKACHCTLPTQPSPLGMGQHRGKSVFFNHGGLLPLAQAGSAAASSLPGICTVHSQGLPSSLPERAAEADAYTG